MNNIQIFKNCNFGEVRTIEIDGKAYFVASDIAKALGYSNTRDAVKKHCKWVAKCDIPPILKF
ncbi:Bro-N domain-containing protein [Clostridioides difficile]|uniref:BRO-N domain-containing protein n=1 Tax=Clostridioides difficile TaxID=1496 RepID=UPI002ED04793